LSTSSSKSFVLGVVGAGRMGGALIAGALASKSLNASQVIAFDLDASKLDALQKQCKIKPAKNIAEVIKQSSLVLLAVKPQVMLGLLKEIKPLASKDQVFVSIAAGITLATLKKGLAPAACVRVMPNNPCLVGAGISAIAALDKVDLGFVRKLFSALGEVVEVEEKLMDAVTALSGSGPAFIYQIVEALVAAGQEEGLSEEMALKFAVQTVFGAGKTLKETGMLPKELKDMVTSPGGTTIEGLRVLQERRAPEAFKAAVLAAAERSKQLSQEFSL